MELKQPHYSAFISYRHCSPDQEIAKRIQRQLETFSIPKSLQKILGRKKVGRIFRDKDEMHISWDLKGELAQALDQSDFLIVICSHSTAESYWVTQEISYFLQHHPADHVLTVLADGEPDEVIPPILTESAVPLSCDYRLSPRKARQQELPRLAATILGCRYDDLRQRQKQRLYRRIIAVGCCAISFVTALSCYYYVTSQRLQAAYDQSLINQSKALAGSSLDAMEDGDRITAMLLALEALPSEEFPRPWTPEAEKALSISMDLYAYKNHPRALRKYPHDAKITDFHSSTDGFYLVSVDISGMVYVWDPKLGELLYTVKSSTVPSLYCLTDLFVLVGDNSISGYRLSDGECLWELQDRVSEITEVVFDDQETSFAYCNYNKELVICGLNGCELLRRCFLPDETDPHSIGISRILTFTPDGGRLFFEWEPDDFSEYRISLYDIADQTFQHLDCSYSYTKVPIFTQEGNLLLIGGETQDDLMNGSYIMGDSKYFCENRVLYTCLDPVSGEILWQTRQSCYFPNFGTQPVLFSYPMPDGTSRNSVCSFLGNICLFLDSQTGELLNRMELPDTVAFVDRVIDNNVFCLLLNGTLVGCNALTGNVVNFPHSVSIDNAVHGESGIYILPENGSQILFYDMIYPQPSKVLTDRTESSLSCNWGRDFYTLKSRGPDMNEIYTGYSIEDGQQLWQIEFTGIISELGVIENTLYLHDYDSLYAINMETGSIIITELPLPENESIQGGLKLLGQWLYCYTSPPADEEMPCRTLHRIDPHDLSVVSLTLPDNFQYKKLSSHGTSIYPSPDGTTVVLESGTEAPFTPVVVDFEKGTVVFLSDPVRKDGNIDYKSGNIAWSPNGELLVTPCDGALQLWNRDGTPMIRLNYGNHLPASTVFTPDGRLAVLFNDSELYVYETDGTLLHRSTITDSGGIIRTNNPCRWQFTDQCVVLSVNNYSCYLLNRDLTGNYAYMQSFLNYNEKRDYFYLKCNIPPLNKKDAICAFKRQTTEEVIRQAREILNGAELTPEQRSRYGLS